MRLVCPSCAAEYEVMSAAIGERGRMVRCAACANEWFQKPEEENTLSPLAPDQPEVEAAAPAPEPEEARPAFTEPVVQNAIEEAETRVEAQVETVEQADAIPASVSIPDFEDASKTFDDEPATPQIYFDEDPVRVEADSDIVEETSISPRPGTDPNELAASLRDNEEPVKSSGGGAFLGGFATITLIALLMIAAYVKAPEIAKLAPAAEGPLAAYAQFVEKGRVALAAAVGGGSS